ncbi:MAG TPA: DUF456 domain-containing protein [Rhodanobacteraceae bacterium]|nr:DUF456 domain-containing protein [Rhodanobacteraceae bacterium]
MQGPFHERPSQALITVRNPDVEARQAIFDFGRPLPMPKRAARTFDVSDVWHTREKEVPKPLDTAHDTTITMQPFGVPDLAACASEATRDRPPVALTLPSPFGRGEERKSSYPARMDWDILWYVISGIVIVAGFVGTLLPILPGIPMMFGGMLLAAWAGHFEKIPVWAIVLLGVLAAFSVVFDFLAGSYGAKRYGASKAAVWGAFIGTIVGLFFGIPGIILGPFVGAVVGQLASGSAVDRAARVGVGTWIGLVIGTAVKLATAFMMLGTFALALLV